MNIFKGKRSTKDDKIIIIFGQIKKSIKVTIRTNVKKSDVLICKFDPYIFKANYFSTLYYTATFFGQLYLFGEYVSILK